MDPAELRLKNFIPSDKFPYLCPLGWTYDSGDYPAAMNLALKMAGYEELRKEQAEKRKKGELMGIGISSFTEIVGAGPAPHLRYRRHQDVRQLRDSHSSHRQSDRAPGNEIARARATRPRFRKSSRRSWEFPQQDIIAGRRRHGYRALRPGNLRQPQHAGGGRQRPRWLRERFATRRGKSRRICWK